MYSYMLWDEKKKKKFVARVNAAFQKGTSWRRLLSSLKYNQDLYDDNYEYVFVYR